MYSFSFQTELYLNDFFLFLSIHNDIIDGNDEY